MKLFYDKLKDIFEEIPNKTRFLKDLGLNSSYSGFRYFMHGRRAEPTSNLLSTISNELGYEYVQVPIKRDTEGSKLKEELQQNFLDDLSDYSQKYADDKARIYAKDFGGISTVAAALVVTEDELKIDDEIKASDLF